MATTAIPFSIFLTNPFGLSSNQVRINVLFGTIENGNVTYEWAIGYGILFILIGGIMAWVGASLPEYSKILLKNMKLIRINNRDVEAWIDLGKEYHELEDLKQAILCTRRAIELYPHKKSTWIFLGRLYEEKRKYISAKECFKNALDIDPEYAEAKKRLENLMKQQNGKNLLKRNKKRSIKR